MQLLFVFNTLTLHKKICQWSGVRHSIKLCQLSNGISNMLMVYGHLVKFTYCFRLQPPWFRLERVCVLSHFSRVRLFATLWTVAHHAPLSMGLSRQEYRYGLLCPPPWHLPNPEVEPVSLVPPALAGRFFTTELPGRILRILLERQVPIQ